MKSSTFFTLFICLLFIQTSFAQNKIKVGPSALFNVSFFDMEITTPVGIEVGYEMGVKEKISLSFVGMFHYAKHESGFIDAQRTPIQRQDTYVGAQAEFHYHYDKMYDGPYIGFGTDLKLLTAKNYFPPTASDPVPTLQDWEFNVGLTWGTFIPVDKGIVNPNIYIGTNPSDQNEYALHAKLGVNYVF